MQRVPLAIVASQKFSIRLDNRRYSIEIKEATVGTSTVMAATIIRDGITIISGQRCLPNTPLLPYLSVEDNAGNFFFTTLLEDIPHWTKFNSEQFLYYATNAEIQAIRNGGQ